MQPNANDSKVYIKWGAYSPSSKSYIAVVRNAKMNYTLKSHVVQCHREYLGNIKFCIFNVEAQISVVFNTVLNILVPNQSF